LEILDSVRSCDEEGCCDSGASSGSTRAEGRPCMDGVQLTERRAWGSSRLSQVCEALLTLLVEVAQKRRHGMVMKDV
jgi:hypothetical protein